MHILLLTTPDNHSQNPRIDHSTAVNMNPVEYFAGSTGGGIIV